MTRRFKYVLALLLIGAGLLSWHRSHRPVEVAVTPSGDGDSGGGPSGLISSTNRAATAVRPARYVAQIAAEEVPGGFVETNFPWRLRNTSAGIDDLLRKDHAILLRHALVDTDSSRPLSVPRHLLAGDHPGSYVVQAVGPVDDGFRRRVEGLGAKIISYIPNNAFLVQSGPEVAERLGRDPGVQAVLAFSPYFKFDSGLLPMAVDREALPVDTEIILTVPTDSLLASEIELNGDTVVATENGAFGKLLTIRTSSADWWTWGRHPEVTLVEWAQPRVLANDLTSRALGVVRKVDITGIDAESAPCEDLVLERYLGLDGEGILVGVNDSGVDAGHVDLAGRVIHVGTDPDFVNDREGHGTHVASIIAGAGRGSFGVYTSGQYCPGWPVFEGKAPLARIFAQPVDLQTGPRQSDEFIQTNAAARGVFISNNSWSYRGLGRPYEYSSASAGYDSATRDSLPRVEGYQPTLYVFAAGNDGSGDRSGSGGLNNRIAAPGNAKNVVTVGALESPRFITNAVVFDTNGLVILPENIRTNADPGTYTTNRLFFADTDSSHQVARFSSRGNVGVGIEGTSGRFKPDVVAPGGHVIAARSRAWKLEDQSDTNSPAYVVTKAMNDELAKGVPPEERYRFESGTSMAAPAVAGLLALVQQYASSNGLPRSPALFKALLINGSRSTGPLYTPDPDDSINYTGWGRPFLPYILPDRLINRDSTDETPGRSVRLIEESHARALATGQTRDFDLQLDALVLEDLEGLVREPTLRITLVWTDPPGNPAASSKLVNDLDLVVSNRVTGDFYIGNHFRTAVEASRPLATNDLPVLAFDRVNNVESIFIENPGTNYVVSVIGRRVNSQSIGSTGGPAGEATLQDFVLVVSTVDAGNQEPRRALSAIRKLAPAVLAPDPLLMPVIWMTNGAPLLDQKAGGHSPRIGDQRGTREQWRFYTFTNVLGETNIVGGVTNVAGTNIAFVTFSPFELGRPRNDEADIDLYVTRNPGLLNLDPAAIAGAFKATSRGGTEVVVLTNPPSDPKVTYYIGVKAEDQQAATYGLIVISSDTPFEDRSAGPPVINMFRVIQPIPDGTSDNPGVGLCMGIGLSQAGVRRITAFQTLAHPSFPDLQGTLVHQGSLATLNNFAQVSNQIGGVVTKQYRDTGGMGFRRPLIEFRPDGPGSLDNFLGAPISGVWFLNTIDAKFGNVGTVASSRLILEENTLDDFVVRVVQPGDCELEVVNIGPEITRMTVIVTNPTPALPLEIFIKREEIPNISDPTQNDLFATIIPPGGSVSIGTRDVPPLIPGRYFIAVCNPNDVAIQYRIKVIKERELDPTLIRSYTTNLVEGLEDLRLSDSLMPVDDGRVVTAVELGLRVNKPLVSDLKVHLMNPRGAKSLIVENRGLREGEGLGTESVKSNYQHVALSFAGSNKMATLYLNGERVAEQQFTNARLPQTEAFYFGSDPSRTFQRRPWPINLDDFGFWRRPLGTNEIRRLYENGLVGTGKTNGSNGLTLWWPFEGDGSEVLRRLDAASGSNPMIRNVGVVGAAVQLGSDQAPVRVDPDPAHHFGSGNNGDFTLEGWVRALDFVDDLVVAGWSDGRKAMGPAILVGAAPPFGGGRGSLSAVFLDEFGKPLVLSGGPGAFTPNDATTNIVETVFLDDTNRTLIPVKFAPAHLQGVYRPEEPLTPLIGVPATGDWRLDVTDDRGLGASGILRQWTLTFTFAPTNIPVVVLTNGMDYTNCLSGNQMGHFIVEVPPEARMATNFLQSTTGGGLDLIYSHLGVPSGDDPDDIFLMSDMRTAAVSVIDTNVPPILPRGNRYYLTVRNTDASQTNCYRLRVDMAVPFVLLTNAIPYGATNANDGFQDIYAFDVSPEALAVRFAVSNMTADVHLRVRRGPALPSKLRSDYQSEQAGTLPEVIDVRLDGAPVPLTPGRWYLGVYPESSGRAPIRYEVSATETRAVVELPLPGTPVTRTNITGQIDYFALDVTNELISFTMLVTNMSANVDAVLRRAALPTTNRFDAISTNLDLIPDFFIVTRTSAPVSLARGRWYLGVYPVDPVPVTYQVIIDVERDKTLEPVVISVRTEEGKIILTFKTERGVNYRIEAARDLSRPVNWTEIGTINGDGTEVTFEIQPSPDVPQRFYRIVAER